MVLLLFFFRFHTYDYARHFVSACTRILGLEGTPEGVEDQGRLTRVAAVKIKTDVFVSHMLYTYLKCIVTLFPFP
jgi:trehalose-6-phosphate synthase